MSQAGGKKEGSERGGKKPSSKTNLISSALTEQERFARQKEMIDALNRQQTHKYLMNIQPNTQSDLVAGRIIGNSVTTIERQLKYGIVEMPDNPQTLPQAPKVVPKMTYDELKEQETKAKRDQINKKIDYLNDQLRGDRESGRERPTLSVEVKQVLTKQEHEQKVKDFQSQWSQMRKRQEQAAEENARRKKQLEEKEAEMRAFEHQKETERKKAVIQSKIKKRKEEHEKYLQIQKQLQKKFQSLRGKERLYHKMEQKYQSEVMLPNLQQKKTKLKQLREFHKNYDIDAIKQHEKKYDLMHEKSKQKLAVNDKSTQKQQFYHPPKRSERLNRLLEADMMAVKQQISGRKMHNEEMQKRLEMFDQDVLARHRPKVDETKKQEILQRYLEEQKKHQRASIDIKRLGDNYLQVAKKMRRSESHHRESKTDKEEQPESEGRYKTDQNSLLLSRAKNRSQDFYESIRRKRIEDIVNSEDNSSKQKFHMLKLETDKIGEKIKQKQELVRMGNADEAQHETAELLLTSIKAKMGIMNVLKHHNKPPGTAQSD